MRDERATWRETLGARLACTRCSRTTSRSWSPTAAASTAPTWRGRPIARVPGRCCASRPTARAIPGAIATSPRRLRGEFHLPHEFVHTSELERPEYRANPSNRCYHCKTELYEHLARLAHDRGFSVIVDGSNADDRGDYRPGRQAAREFGVRSPLDRGRADQGGDSRAGAATPACRSGTSRRRRACRRASRIRAKSPRRSWRPSSRPKRSCARSASASSACGITTRWRGSRSAATKWRARSSPAINQALVTRLKAIGYKYVSLDLQGYRTGSLNEVLRLRPV